MMTPRPRRTLRQAVIARLDRIFDRDFYGDFYGDPARGLHGKASALDRAEALRDLLTVTGGRTVLDLGCAEGMIAERFLAAGAGLVHGFDIKPRRIAAARRLVADDRARFAVGDLSDWTVFSRRHALLARYDIVLFLGIYQHLPLHSRQAVLRGAARRSRGCFALRAPRELLDEATEILAGEGLRMIREQPGNGRGVGRFRLYVRDEPAAAEIDDGSSLNEIEPARAAPRMLVAQET